MVSDRPRAYAIATVMLLVACATALPTQATRIVQPEPGRVVEIKVGEQIRVDAPNTTLRWSLIGGDSVVGVEAAPGDQPLYWTLTGREPGEVEIALEGAPQMGAPIGSQPPAPPRITFLVRVLPAS